MIRFFDLFFSIMGTVILFPFFILIASIIKLNSRGPVFFKQIRVGRFNRDFSLLKFRTMHVNSDKLGLLTVGGRDRRITSVGYFLRKYKLDELPQLINVIKGDMSIVGARPEVRKYVNLYTPEQLKVLDTRPGITDFASIKYSNENEILERAKDPEEYYIKKVMPDKILLNMQFINAPYVATYFKVIFLTFLKIIRH